MKIRLGMLVLASLVASAQFAGCGSSGSDVAADAGDANAPTVHPDGGLPPVDASAAHPLCVNGVSVDGDYPNLPTSVALLGTVPNFSFDGLDETGAKKTVKLSDYYEPCAAQSRLLVLRVTASWCGSCRYNLAHTQDMLQKAYFGARLRFLDLLVGDEDNNPATQADLASQRARIDAPQAMGADPAARLQTVTISGSSGILPLLVLVDTKTMQIRNYLSNPDPAEEAYRLGGELADLDGIATPAYPDQTLIDNQWSPDQWALLEETVTPAAPPADPTNLKADDAAAAALGKLLFSDKTLSPSGAVGCVTCHDFTKGTSDGLPQSEGVSRGDRNAPAIALAAFARWQFWDGRADSLWAQATGPFENPKEFGSSRLFVAHQIYTNYQTQYQAVWTAYPLPDLTDTVRFPPSGMPGVAAYDGMAQADKDAVTRILVNVAKSIAAYERTIRVQPTKLDAYVGGDLTALSGDEKKGLDAFVKLGCQQCHWGPRLTDDAFHNTRFPTGRQDGMADRGRIDVVQNVLTGEFISSSVYSDAPAPHSGISHLSAANSLLGSFKTPTLRGITESAPYGHGGQEAMLLDVAKLYGSAGLDPANPGAVGVAEPWLPHFDTTVQPTLVPLLEALTANAAAP